MRPSICRLLAVTSVIIYLFFAELEVRDRVSHVPANPGSHLRRNLKPYERGTTTQYKTGCWCNGKKRRCERI